MQTRKLKLPLHLLALDAVGVVLAGLGLAEWFAGTNLVPPAFQFENYSIVMVVVGGLLTMPAIVHIVKSARGKHPREI